MVKGKKDIDFQLHRSHPRSKIKVEKIQHVHNVHLNRAIVSPHRINIS